MLGQAGGPCRFGDRPCDYDALGILPTDPCDAIARMTGRGVRRRVPWVDKHDRARQVWRPLSRLGQGSALIVAPGETARLAAIAGYRDGHEKSWVAGTDCACAGCAGDTNAADRGRGLRPGRPIDSWQIRQFWFLRFVFGCAAF